MMPFKEWLFYLIVAWNPDPLKLLEEQKTIMLQFDIKKECESIASQVKDQITKNAPGLKIKQLGCYRCETVMEKNRCPAQKAPPKA